MSRTNMYYILVRGVCCMYTGVTIKLAKYDNSHDKVNTK